MKRYTLLNVANFRSGAVQLYKIFDTETREVYYYGTAQEKGARSSQNFTGTRRAVNRWRQSLGSS